MDNHGEAMPRRCDETWTRESKLLLKVFVSYSYVFVQHVVNILSNCSRYAAHFLVLA